LQAVRGEKNGPKMGTREVCLEAILDIIYKQVAVASLRIRGVKYGIQDVETKFDEKLL
jgi:hypothetical protein